MFLALLLSKDYYQNTSLEDKSVQKWRHTDVEMIPIRTWKGLIIPCVALVTLSI